MTVRRSLTGLTAVAVLAAMPLMGMPGIAAAKAKAAAPKCVKHPNRAKCLTSGGGAASGGGTGGSSPQITVQVDPEPLVETGQSDVYAIIQVESLPSFAGDLVNVDSSQLSGACHLVIFDTLQINPQTVPPGTQGYDNNIGIVLDDDGNATVEVTALDCAPGDDVIEADLEVAPFLTALTTLDVLPPTVTPEGLSVYPRFGGLNQEVETGDTATSGDSDVYAVFYVETNPVYAEQTVEINSPQLQARCVQGWEWFPNFDVPPGVGPGDSSRVSGIGPTPIVAPSTVLDDDGNAVFVFYGVSCASGPSEVIADVDAGSHPTYVTDFTVLPPTPTI